MSTEFESAAVPPARRMWRTVVAAGIPVVLAPFGLQFVYILSQFYYFGAVLDASLLASVVWHNELSLMPPWWYSSCSYLSFHFSPLLEVVNGLSYLSPTSLAEYYGAFVAATYTLVGVAMYRALIVCFQPKRWWQVGCFALMAIAFSFNGVLEQSIWVDHFEYAIPGFLILFLVEFKRGRRGWAALWLGLALSVREDAGFHLAGLLVVVAAIEWRRKRSFAAIKGELGVAAIAVAYSVCAWFMATLIRRSCGGSTQFEAVYTGTPAYAHLDWHLLAGRSYSILKAAPYLPAAAGLSFVWAALRRNLYWLAGFAAFVPWFVLNWTAKSDACGLISGYYAFPFLLAMAWPILAVMFEHGRNVPRRALREALVLEILLLMIGLVTWDPGPRRPAFVPEYWSHWASYKPKWIQWVDGRRRDTRARVRQVAREIGSNPNLGIVLADPGVLAWTFESAAQIENVMRFNERHGENVDTIAYFCPGGGHPTSDLWDAVVAAAKKGRLVKGYWAYPASICLVTNRSERELGPLLPLLRPLPFDAGPAH